MSPIRVSGSNWEVWPHRGTLEKWSKNGTARVRKKGSFGKGVFSESPLSRDSREPPDCGKQSSDHFLEILERDSRDSSSEKTPFVMTPFSGPEQMAQKKLKIGAFRPSCLRLFGPFSAFPWWGQSPSFF